MVAQEIGLDTPRAAFSRQVERLLRLGYPRAAERTKDQFLKEVEPLGVHFSTDDLIAIPQDMVSIASQLQLVGGRIPSDITSWAYDDIPPLPTMPFLATNVCDGTSLWEVSPRDCLRRFKKQHRYGLTVAEGLALVIHRPDTITSRRSVDLPGSICLHYGERHTARLRRDSRGIILDIRLLWPTCSTSGSASCQKRIVP